MLLIGIILVFLFLFVFGLFLFLLDSLFGGLDFATGQKVIDQVASIIKERHLENANFYDLGSARGNFAVKISKALPNMQITGIDDSGFRTFFAKTRSIFKKNLNFKKADIFKFDVSAVDIAYIYLPQELMAGLQSKLQKELKPGSIVITNKVSFPNWKASQVLEKLFIYQI